MLRPFDANGFAVIEKIVAHAICEQFEFSAADVHGAGSRGLLLVALHQDLSIPVRDRVESRHCAGWSRKEGQWFVQPPVQVLEQLTAVRVHVDASTTENGPLRIVPGSHRNGRLTSSQARLPRQSAGEIPVLAARGDAIVMRPLILHASSKADLPIARRVLHFLFGPRELPHGLVWSLAI